MYVKLEVSVHNRKLTPLQVREMVAKAIEALELAEYSSDLDVEIATHSGKCSQENCGEETKNEDHASER